MAERFRPGLMSRHAWQAAQHEKIPIEMIGFAYDDPDAIRSSEHDEFREIRSRWFGPQGVEIVVDLADGRVVTAWRKGERR